jgi:protease YdgD
MSCPVRNAALGAALLFLTTVPVAAEVLPSDPLIGRINHAGYNRHAHCTGFMVEGGHLVTAAHCLPRAERAVHYLAGYDRGKFLRHIESPKSRFRVLRDRDIAILCNAKPDGAGRSVSDNAPATAASVKVAGYAAPRSQVLQAKVCEVIRAGQSAIEIGCPLSPGNSGGPLIQRTNGTDQIAGVISATSRHSGIASRLRPADLNVCD